MILPENLLYCPLGRIFFLLSQTTLKKCYLKITDIQGKPVLQPSGTLKYTDTKHGIIFPTIQPTQNFHARTVSDSSILKDHRIIVAVFPTIFVAYIL